jgi:antitoxin HicB
MNGRYSMSIQWSDEDHRYIVSLPEWGDLVHAHGAMYEEAVKNGQELLDDLIAVRQELGEPLLEPRVFATA